MFKPVKLTHNEIVQIGEKYYTLRINKRPSLRMFAYTTEGLKQRLKERNPAHFCSCGKYISHRGFCSKKCHDEYYDKSINIEKEDD